MRISLFINVYKYINFSPLSSLFFATLLAVVVVAAAAAAAVCIADL